MLHFGDARSYIQMYVCMCRRTLRAGGGQCEYSFFFLSCFFSLNLPAEPQENPPTHRYASYTRPPWVLAVKWEGVGNIYTHFRSLLFFFLPLRGLQRNFSSFFQREAFFSPTTPLRSSIDAAEIIRGAIALREFGDSLGGLIRGLIGNLEEMLGREVEGSRTAEQIATGVLDGAAFGAFGNALLEGRHGRPLVDPRPVRRDDVLHHVPHVLRYPPRLLDRYHVPLPHRVRGVVYEFVPWCFEPLRV